MSMNHQWCIWNMKPLLTCMFGSMCVHGCETECAACTCDERKRDSGERERGRVEVCHLENQWRTVPASAHWSDSWTYLLAVRACAGVRTYRHNGANRALWACLSCPSEIGSHYRVNEPNKPIAINWGPQLTNCQWEVAEFPQGKEY